MAARQRAGLEEQRPSLGSFEGQKGVPPRQRPDALQQRLIDRLRRVAGREVFQVFEQAQEPPVVVIDQPDLDGEPGPRADVLRLVQPPVHFGDERRTDWVRLVAVNHKTRLYRDCCDPLDFDVT